MRPALTSASRPVNASFKKPELLASALTTGGATNATPAPPTAPVLASSGFISAAVVPPVTAPPVARKAKSRARAPTGAPRAVCPVEKPPVRMACDSPGATRATGAASTVPAGAVASTSAPSSPVPVAIGNSALNGATRACDSARRRAASAAKTCPALSAPTACKPRPNSSWPPNITLPKPLMTPSDAA